LVTARNGSTKSIGNVVTAIRQRALLNGYGWITELQTNQLKDLVTQMRFNDSIPVQRKKPIQIKHLIKGTANWNLSDPRVLQEAVILFVGHDCLFRIGELLGGLKVSDITWASDHSMFHVWLGRSKANRSGDGELITVTDYSGRSGVKLMKLWFDEMGLWNTDKALLFPSRKSIKGWNLEKTISSSWVRGSIKRLALSLGLEAKWYSGHSLRSGGATDLFVQRVPYFLIKKMGRWKSEAAMIYYRCDDDVRQAVAVAFDNLAKEVGGGVCR